MLLFFLWILFFFNNILREYSLENKFLNKPHINMIIKLHDTIMKVKPFKKIILSIDLFVRRLIS